MNKGTTVIRVFNEAPSFYLVIMLLHDRGFLVEFAAVNQRQSDMCVWNQTGGSRAGSL